MHDRLITSEVRAARERLGQLGRWYAERPSGTTAGELDAIVAADRELERAARTARLDLVLEVERRTGPFAAPMLSALVDVPRERFVRPSDIAESAMDTPLLLDDEGHATISAPHAYLLSFQVLGLESGDRLAELGTGSGYGAALGSHLVAPSGEVLSVEIDEALASRARALLGGYANVRVVTSDATAALAEWSGFSRISVTFAVDGLPGPWLDAIPEGGRLVAPVGGGDGQRLVRVERAGGELAFSDHGAVRYVRNRGRETRVF